MKISIRWVLIAGLLLIIWGSQVVTVSSGYISSQRVLLGHARDIMENIAEFAMAQSHHHLAMAQGAAHLTKRLITGNVVGSAENQISVLEQYFYDQLAIYPHFSGIYFGNPNGDFYDVRRNSARSPDGFRTKIIRHMDGRRQVSLIWRNRDLEVVARESDPEDTYDPRIRPWYTKAATEKKIVWTDPYVFFTSQKPGITIAGPVFQDKEFLKGIVGVDIEIDQLSTFIGKLRIGKNGRAFMMNRNEDVVAFPDLEKITMANPEAPGKTRLVKISEIDDPLSRKAFEAVNWQRDNSGKLVIDKPLFAKFESDGEVYTVMFTPFSDEQWPWVIGVYIPENDYLGAIKANGAFIVFMTVIISIIATVIGLFVGRGIIRPMAALEQEALAVREHRLDPTPMPRSVYKEIQETADAFARMKAALKDHETEKSRLERQIRHSQKMEAIGTLAGGVAHDFNNILYPIIGFTEMALDDLPDESSSRESMQEVLIAAHRAQDLIRQILTFSRLDAPDRIPLEMQPLITEALNLLRAALPANVEIQKQIDSRCGPVLANPSQIQQIIINLCTNAFHAMTPQGGVMTVTLETVRIASEDNPRDLDLDSATYAKLTVHDTGSGMADEIRERIFEPYFTTKTTGDGTGMGLAVIHGIVKAYDGDIQVRSTPGLGSVFEIYLPCTTREVPETAPVDALAPPSGSEKILLVEDEVQTVKMLEKMLTGLGYRPRAFTDAQAALAEFEKDPSAFDLVITDLTMPKVTGDVLARRMLQARPDLPIIMCTGFSPLMDEDQARALGIRKLIYKPMDRTELAMAVRQVLDG
ncbi:MAG: response regulator [Desulfobacterales bacterium]|nr:response regulator [Desulfobacterales bacterium]